MEPRTTTTTTPPGETEVAAIAAPRTGRQLYISVGGDYIAIGDGITDPVELDPAAALIAAEALRHAAQTIDKERYGSAESGTGNGAPRRDLRAPIDGT